MINIDIVYTGGAAHNFRIYLCASAGIRNRTRRPGEPT
ncbi:hypothetical protein PATSB16_41970 [Pandoraea thiooxydans]|nr:hypothetical protein PATSB16_41970 [Pandoraea thiooxydans]